jgi:hypothetical protein
MTANRNIHLTKKPHHLVRGDSEFTRHVMYAKLAQAPLLRITSHARPNELANSSGELWIDDAHSGRLITSNCGSQLRRRRTLNELNTPCPEQRHDLLLTVRRRVIGHDGEFQISFFRRRAYLLDADNDVARADAETNQSKQAIDDAAVHGNGN